MKVAEVQHLDFIGKKSSLRNLTNKSARVTTIPKQKYLKRWIVCMYMCMYVQVCVGMCTCIQRAHPYEHSHIKKKRWVILVSLFRSTVTSPQDSKEYHRSYQSILIAPALLKPQRNNAPPVGSCLQKLLFPERPPVVVGRLSTGGQMLTSQIQVSLGQVV